MFIFAGTINSWVVIFILPINSALNPILYTLTTSFFREKVELLLCRWQRRSVSKKDRKSLTSSTIYMETSRNAEYPAKISLPRLSLADMDNQYGWKSQWVNVSYCRAIIIIIYVQTGEWRSLLEQFRWKDGTVILAIWVPVWSALFRHMTLASLFSPLGEAFLITLARWEHRTPPASISPLNTMSGSQPLSWACLSCLGLLSQKLLKKKINDYKTQCTRLSKEL